MTAIAVSKRGTITLPPDIRKRLGLDVSAHPMVLAEIRDGGVFLQPAEAMPVRDIPLATMKAWIDEDERNAGRFREKAAKQRGPSSTAASSFQPADRTNRFRA